MAQTEGKRASARARRSNRKARNTFSHADDAVLPTQPKAKRAHPSLQLELNKRGITIAELTERAHAWDNDRSQQEIDKLASAVISYMSHMTSKTQRLRWCVIPGFEFDARLRESSALIDAEWAGYTRTYRPHEYLAAQAEFDQMKKLATDRLMEATKNFPAIHKLAQEMGTELVPANAQQAAAREMVTQWLIADAMKR